MAFSVQRFRRAFSTPFTTRGFRVPSPEVLDTLKAFLLEQRDAVSPALVSLNTSFLSPSGSLRASGVFLAPNLIATAVGRLATSYEPLTVEKPDRFEHGRIRTKPDIGSTVALTLNGKTLETKPLAVNFANDLAVLEVEGENFPHLALASSVPRVGEELLAIYHTPNYSRAIIMTAKVRATGGERMIRVKAPWPLDDRSEWIEHDWLDSGDGTGKRPPLSNFGEKLTASIAKVGTGIPWFNFDSEVVSITSWQVGNDPTFYKVGFTVPSPVIRSVLEYAKTKGPDDPLVMEGCVSASS